MFYFRPSSGATQLDAGEDLLLTNQAPGSGFLNNSEFLLTRWFVQNALPLNEWAFRVSMADMPDCPHCGSGLEETALHAFYNCEQFHQFWSGQPTSIPNSLCCSMLVMLWTMLILHIKGVVFLTILAVARMVIWEMQKKGLYDGANFSHHNLILFFRHQLRIKIRCNRKHLDQITFNKRWVYVAGLVVLKGATLESSFLPHPMHGDEGPGPSGPHSQ